MEWLRLIVFFCSCAFVTPLTLRIVSWNVQDNKGMGGGVDKTVLRQLLGLEALGESAKAYFDMYAVTFQENCYKCNEANWKYFSDMVLDQLNDDNTFFQYEYIGHALTRVSSVCQKWACGFTNQHGTTHLYVFAKRGYLQRQATFHTNNCMGGWVKNAEKGIAAVIANLRNSKKLLCFGGLHLDTHSATERARCFTKFIREHGAEWKRCTHIFFAGDFNTKTGPTGGSKTTQFLTNIQMQYLRRSDDMCGSNPWDKKRLIDDISKAHGRTFNDSGPLDFYPTSKLEPASKCGNNWPCYNGERAPSWVDRIVCSPCKTFQYKALPIKKSDHLPVYGIYTI